MGSGASPQLAPAHWRIGFFRTLLHHGVFSAAALVTDRFGMPIEFKYIAPIQPDELQRQVYGGQLEEHVKNRLMKPRLLESLTTNPMFFLAAWDEWTLSGSLGGFDYLAVRAERNHRHLPEPDDVPAGNRRVTNREMIIPARHGPPLRLKFTTDAAGRQEELAAQLLTFDESMDILEPLERLEGALQHICAQARP